MGRENVKNIRKTNKLCYCLGGGEFKTWEGGGPKGPEKTLLIQKNERRKWHAGKFLVNELFIRCVNPCALAAVSVLPPS